MMKLMTVSRKDLKNDMREEKLMNFERIEKTFWEDFKVAIPFGIKAINDTYNSAL